MQSKQYFTKIKNYPHEKSTKPVYLRIKRRRWEDPETGQTYSRDWNLVASGTRITAEFGAFLKALLRQSCG